MACISCGVITRAWLWRNSRRCERAIASRLVRFLLSLIPAWRLRAYAIPQRGNAPKLCVISRCLKFGQEHFDLHPEFFAEIQPADVRIADDLVRAALHQHLARIDDVGAVGEAER